MGIIPSNSSIIHCGDVAEYNKQHQATQATHLVLKVVLQQTGWLLSTFEVLIGVEELANGFRELKQVWDQTLIWPGFFTKSILKSWFY